MKRRQSPNQLANLKKARWKKGESGNPKGRPPLLPDLRTLLAKVMSEERDGLSAAEAVLRSLFNKALKGDVRASEVLLERGWGKVPNNLDLTSKGNALSAPIINVNDNGAAAD